ncbi:hypothetical protein RRG08_046524 [Elysia crispata]|uniref:Uncharacterized protein n=1 Tax=Elysia crispata TaxID=231223 RepID=A0AAE1DB58_9GAST|nr:hypothetical protein RRG08_046524 [Elysia crispata]
MSNTSILNDYLAGCIGGGAGMIAGHPLDTVKVQIQTQEYGGKYSSLMDCFKTVNQQKMSKGFFRGLSWPLLSSSYLNAIFFGTYGLVLKKLDYLDDLTHKPSYWTLGFAAAVATAPQLLFSVPVEVIKVTLQSQIPHVHDVPAAASRKYYKGPFQAVRDIAKTSGLRGLYRGFRTQFVRDTPAASLYMMSYTFFQYEAQLRQDMIPSQVTNFVGGGVAGVLSWLIIMPFDVVKSKIQADPAGKMYQGFWDCARHLYSSGGIKVFFLGFVPMAVRAFPVNAVTLMVYSEVLEQLNRGRSI